MDYAFDSVHIIFRVLTGCPNILKCLLCRGNLPREKIHNPTSL